MMKLAYVQIGKNYSLFSHLLWFNNSLFEAPILVLIPRGPCLSPGRAAWVRSGPLQHGPDAGQLHGRST